MIPSDKVDLAEKHVSDILSVSFEYSEDSQKALVIYDTQCALSQVLTEAYQRCLPKAKFVNFDEVSQESILSDFESLKPSDLVVLIQSTSFRLDKFRIRVTLFNRSIKVIEHPHLLRIQGDEQLVYIDALAYDAKYYRGVGYALQARIDRASLGVLKSGGEELIFSDGFEPAKLNIGDYTGMRNVGGQFPIGEVFTESKELESVNGRVNIFAFGDMHFKVSNPKKPITLVIKEGRVTEAIDSTPEFDEVLVSIREREDGEVWVRELGFGLNRAFTKKCIVTDIGTYERMCGVHLSLGAKHNVYKKPNFKFTNKTAKFHVDIFVDTEAMILDGDNIYQDERWCV